MVTLLTFEERVSDGRIIDDLHLPACLCYTEGRIAKPFCSTIHALLHNLVALIQFHNESKDSRKNGDPEDVSLPEH